MNPSMAILEHVALSPRSETAFGYHDLSIDDTSFNQPQTGLGLYYQSEPQVLTPPPLSASLPETPASWTSQQMTPGLQLQTVDAKLPQWSPPLGEYTPMTDASFGWSENNAIRHPTADHVHHSTSSLAFQSEPVMDPSLVPSHRSSLSSTYQSASEGYTSDENGQNIDPLALETERSDCWTGFGGFERLSVSAAMENVSTGMEGISPGATSGVEPYHFGAIAYSCSSSVQSSPTVQPAADPRQRGDLLRASSLPGCSREPQGTYEKALDKSNVARVRKRRRMTAPSRTNIVCENCGRGFSRAHNLKTHLQTHSSRRSKPWSCTWEGCDLSFARRTDLERHQNSVSLTHWYLSRCIC